jgi:intergrase/recombinase
MQGIQHTAPVYEKMQWAAYCFIYGVPDADLVQSLRTAYGEKNQQSEKNCRNNVSATRILIHYVRIREGPKDQEMTWKLNHVSNDSHKDVYVISQNKRVTMCKTTKEDSEMIKSIFGAGVILGISTEREKEKWWHYKHHECKEKQSNKFGPW